MTGYSAPGVGPIGTPKSNISRRVAVGSVLFVQGVGSSWPGPRRPDTTTPKATFEHLAAVEGDRQVVAEPFASGCVTDRPFTVPGQPYSN